VRKSAPHLVQKLAPGLWGAAHCSHDNIRRDYRFTSTRRTNAEGDQEDAHPVKEVSAFDRALLAEHFAEDDQ
jgi:hypothetical protein